jgi:hypothetical protein
MPRIKPSPKRLDLSVELLNAAHAHRLGVGWLTAREAGITTPLVGGDFLEKWSGARNLPAMLKLYQPQARLMYRIRLLCLALHGHHFAAACGGPEVWWQHILEEDILAAISQRLTPQIYPEAKTITPPTRAVAVWWMRRGINTATPITKPATWALLEATQARVYPSRGECARPADDTPLPLAALNGDWSLTKRKQLLREITGSDSGWRLNDRIELARDWAEMIRAWQLTAKESTTKMPPARFTDATRYEACAVVIHDVVMPPWWASVNRIAAALNQIPENKPSVGLRSGPPG